MRAGKRTLTAMAVIAAGLLASAPALAQGKGKSNCFNKAAEGTNTSEEGAKFQAYEAILSAIADGRLILRGSKKLWCVGSKP